MAAHAAGLHRLRVFVADDAPHSTDPNVLSARRRLNLAPGESIEFWRIEFLHLRDAKVENSAAWLDGGSIDAQSASRRALQQLHLDVASPSGHATRLHQTTRDGPASLCKHTLIATAAASWTLADVALVPVAMLLGLIPAEAADDILQPALGPVPPFARRSRASALDLSRWTLRFGGHLQQLPLGGSPEHSELPRMSLSTVARQCRAFRQATAGESGSFFTLRLTEGQLRNFDLICSRADTWRACLGPSEPRESLRTALKGKYDGGRGSQTLTVSDQDWSNEACVASHDNLSICDAAHLVPRAVGDEAFDAALHAFRTEDAELGSDTALDELAFLDPRLGSLLPPAAPGVDGSAAQASEGLDSACNGVFLSLHLHSLLDKFAFMFTPSLHFAHVTWPVNGKLSPLGHLPLLRDVAGTGEPNALKPKLPMLHLSSFVSLCALFLVSTVGLDDSAPQAAATNVSVAGLSGSEPQAEGSAAETATCGTGGEADAPPSKRSRTGSPASEPQTRSAEEEEEEEEEDYHDWEVVEEETEPTAAELEAAEEAARLQTEEVGSWVVALFAAQRLAAAEARR